MGSPLVVHITHNLLLSEKNKKERSLSSNRAGGDSTNSFSI